MICLHVVLSLLENQRNMMEDAEARIAMEHSTRMEIPVQPSFAMMLSWGI
jgi:hypothetical protein